MDGSVARQRSCLLADRGLGVFGIVMNKSLEGDPSVSYMSSACSW